MCAPALYFRDILPMTQLEFLGFRPGETPEREKRIAWREAVTAARLIVIGGGGLLNIDFFEPAFRHLAEIRRPDQKVVIWGAGHNSWQVSDWRHLKPRVDLHKDSYDLIGIRDDNQPFDWVPCVSCMDPIFDSPPSPTCDVALYAHAGTINNPKLRELLPRGLPTLDNNAAFKDAISFVMDCDLLLTDSYHGVYWATLLGRRVIAFPSSSKFYDLRFPVPLCDPSDWRRYARLAVRYPDALAECRAANRDFAARVADLL